MRAFQVLWTMPLSARTLGGHRIEAPPDDPDEMFTGYYFPPIHLQRHVMERFGFKAGDFPQCERISQRTVTLPFFTDMEEDDVRLVCETLKQCPTEIR